MIRPYLKILRRRDFFFLWFGQLVSQFGDKLTQIALIGLVTSFFKRPSPLVLAIIISMTIIPAVIFSAITGVYVDRWSKRKTMYISDLLRGICILLIPIFFFKSQFFFLICALIFLSSSVGRFFIPAKMALIPHIIKKEDIFLANSLISVTATAAALFGIGLGGIFVDRFGEKIVFNIDALTFLLSAFSIFLISVKEKESFIPQDFLRLGKEVVTNVKTSIMKELKEGIKYIFTAHETKFALKITLFLYSYIGALSTVYIAYIQNILDPFGKNIKAVGFTAIALTMGIFIGSLIYGRIAHKYSTKKTINYSIIFASCFLIFFVVYIKNHPYLIYAVFLVFILGLIISPLFIAVNSLIHRKSEVNLLGRIFAGLEVVSHLGFLAAMFISSLFAKIFNPFVVIIFIGIIGFIFSLIFIIKND
ncbi:MAG: MFS transporter [Candidatus Omnitrophota bacterium]|nr:MFS transporter [Candidatus Omnitrophota bacterium]